MRTSSSGNENAQGQTCRQPGTRALSVSDHPEIWPIVKGAFKEACDSETDPVSCSQLQRRAALGVVNNRKLGFATKCQVQLPVERKDKLHIEVMKLTAQRSDPNDASKTPSEYFRQSKVQKVWISLHE